MKIALGWCIVSETKKAISNDPKPEPKPLIITICTGSFKEIILVQLFSKPQQMQPKIRKTVPGLKTRIDVTSKVKMIVDSSINKIENHICLPIAS